MLVDGGGSEQLLRSVYFDTPDFDLRAAGVALRVRQADGRCVQTIKLAGRGLFGRGEWKPMSAAWRWISTPAAGTPLEGALSTADRDTPLRPVFEVRVDRATRDVAVGGRMVEVALDRGSVSADGRDTPICELELELKDGAIADLFDLARSLAGRADLNLAFTSKAERGYALVERKALDACPAKRPKLDSKAGVGDAFKVIGGGALSQVAFNARILRTVRRPEALHQLRVGLRRMRSALTLFDPMLAADDRLAPITAELKWISEETCEARDLDVFIARTFRRAAQQHHSARGLGAFGESLLAAQTRAYERTEQAIRSARFRSLMLETAAWIEIGAWSNLRRSASRCGARPAGDGLRRRHPGRSATARSARRPASSKASAPARATGCGSRPRRCATPVISSPRSIGARRVASTTRTLTLSPSCRMRWACSTTWR